MYKKGSHASWKVLDLLGKIYRPWRVLENGFGPGKSWNFLGYDVGGGHNNADVEGKNCCDHLLIYSSWICLFFHFCQAVSVQMLAMDIWRNKFMLFKI